MARELPPKFVAAPSWLVYSAGLPAPVFQTALRIWGLGWRSQYKQAGPVTLEFLLQVCELSRASLYGHLSALVGKSILRYRNDGGRFWFWFDDAAVQTLSPESWTTPTIHDVGSDSDTDSDQQQQILYVHTPRESKILDCEHVDPDVLGMLHEIGVAEPTRSELAQLEWVNADYLAAWEGWLQSQDRVGIGWLVQQIRAGLEAPMRQRDGERDGHWYVSGAFGEFIQH